MPLCAGQSPIAGRAMAAVFIPELAPDQFEDIFKILLLIHNGGRL
jgi:hypothetical protein